MSKKQKFWEKYSDLKETIFVTTAIIGIFGFFGLGALVYNTVFVLPKSNLDFCPHVSSTGGCGIDSRFSCGEVKLITNTCSNESKFIESYATIFNKGLAIANNVELVITLVNVEFPMLDAHWTETFVGIQIDGIEKTSQRLFCPTINCTISYVLDVLKPSDFTNIRFYLKNIHEADILKNPERVIFQLKENDQIIGTKGIILHYE